jgi:uncharacterized protein (TIGR01732 family)
MESERRSSSHRSSSRRSSSRRSRRRTPFPLIVVLFILLIIVGTSFMRRY